MPSAHLARLFPLHTIPTHFSLLASRARRPHAAVPQNLSSCVVLPARTFFITPFCSLLFPLLYSRTMASSSSSNPPPPAERAAEIIDKLPSLARPMTTRTFDQTFTALLGRTLLATAIAKVSRFFSPSRRLL